jgi:carbon monoxide dehydrogenase subunit G
VAFYSVSYAGEEIATLESDREKEGYPWSVALPAGSMLQDLEVAVQSTQVAIDSRGVIINRKGFGQGSEDAWRETFQALAASAQ